MWGAHSLTLTSSQLASHINHSSSFNHPGRPSGIIDAFLKTATVYVYVSRVTSLRGSESHGNAHLLSHRVVISASYPEKYSSLTDVCLPLVNLMPTALPLPPVVLEGSVGHAPDLKWGWVSGIWSGIKFKNVCSLTVMSLASLPWWPTLLSLKCLVS